MSGRCLPLAAVAALMLFTVLLRAEEKPAAKFTNRLAKETSPYLRLHAHNPVDWYPWGPEAFAKAKKENKLVFLSIGYSSCYWCHVMERQSFNNPAIAKLMNDSFVCIKVDREERPEVDNIYMMALHIQGQRGGWPLSMFLLPDGKPIGGGTYWPPEDREQDGERSYGFKSILKLVNDDWQRQPDKLKEVATKIAAAVSTEVAGAGKRVPVLAFNRELVADAVTSIKEDFDPEHAGFGSKARQFRGPKFPQPVMAELLITAHQQKKDDESQRMITQTLDRMARGGIYDHLGGGFHRYSTDRAWKVPHFEKMLYDNAQLVSLYSRAYTLTKDPAYQRVVEETLAFIAREMTSPEGGFYSALDAETDAEEGKFYVWTATEIDKTLQPADAELFKRVYGVSAGPNFEEKYNVLLLPQRTTEVAGAMNLTEEQLLAKLQPIKQKLLDIRAKRARPLLDTKILTGWNGLMIASYADAAMAFKNPAYATTGEKAAAFLLKNLRGHEGRLLRTCSIENGKVDAKLNAYLEDYAFLIFGLINLHDATAKKQWLDEARSLADAMIEHYGDKEAGGFFFTSHDHEKLFARAKDQYDGATPSGNSIAALDLVRLAQKTKEPRYAQQAEGTFKAFAETLKTSPASSTAMHRALALWLDDKDKKKDEKTLDNPFKTDDDPVKAPEPVKASAAITSQKITGDGSVAVSLTLTLEVEKGWHAYANPAGDESLIPTTIEVKAANKLEDVKVSYPAGKERKEEGVKETIYTYEGKISIPITLRRPLVEKKADTSPLEISIKYQACSESKCLPPKTIKVKAEGK